MCTFPTLGASFASTVTRIQYSRSTSSMSFVFRYREYVSYLRPFVHAISHRTDPYSSVMTSDVSDSPVKYSFTLEINATVATPSCRPEAPQGPGWSWAPQVYAPLSRQVPRNGSTPRKKVLATSVRTYTICRSRDVALVPMTGIPGISTRSMDKSTIPFLDSDAGGEPCKRSSAGVPEPRKHFRIVHIDGTSVKGFGMDTVARDSRV